MRGDDVPIMNKLELGSWFHSIARNYKFLLGGDELDTDILVKTSYASHARTHLMVKLVIIHKCIRGKFH